MPIQRHLINQEIPILLLVTAAAGLVLYDATVSHIEGFLLLFSLGPLLLFMVWSKKKHPEEESSGDDIHDMQTITATMWFLIGLIALIASSEVLVWGARQTATAFGVSPLIIGLTVIAVGTSLPELAASVMSALRGHHEMALGNIIRLQYLQHSGSNVSSWHHPPHPRWTHRCSYGILAPWPGSQYCYVQPLSSTNLLRNPQR